MQDFADLAADLLGRAHDLVPSWLPGGKVRGHEFVVGDLHGNPGRSLSVNLKTGAWADFSSGDLKGGDLISLYAAINNCGQGEAAKRLREGLGIQRSPTVRESRKVAKAPTVKLGKPPVGTPPVEGRWDHLWPYFDTDGGLLYCIARINAKGEEPKKILQFSWDLDAGRWVGKAYPEPRPLFNLDLLAKRPTAPVMIVEGEKAADAAREIAGHSYVVMTWPGGSKAVSKADWSPLAGRKVLIWPDADKPGLEAADQIANLLHGKAAEIKIIAVDEQAKGWDAADALAEGWGWDRLVAWAKPRALVWQSPVVDAPRATTSVVYGDPQVQQPQTEHVPTDAELEAHMPAVSDAEAPPVCGFASWSDLGLQVNAKGNPFANLHNADLCLSRWEGVRGMFWYDEFHGKILRRGRKGEDARAWDDHDTLELSALLQDRLALPSFSDDLWFKAVTLVAKRNTRNEPLDWIRSLKWDGTPRLNEFLTDCLGVASTPYTQAASRNFWLSLVARVVKPGCKVDTMLILEGGQGKRKSSALASIVGPKWHTEATESVTSKDFFMCLQGKLLVEIAELDSFGKAEATRVKQVISNRVDTYRAPYGRISEDHPRRCVFAGTTNESHYLRDSTGGRRFWPVRVGDVDLDAIAAMREQCFAEAYHLVSQGASWWDMPEKETMAAQEDRRAVDPWEDVIRGWLADRQEVSPQDIYLDVLGIEVSRQGRAEQLRVAACMKALGWESDVAWRNGKSRRIWKRQG